MSSLLLLAATQPSKVPFYICGGLLAVWAVVLAAIGLSRPSFPRSLTGQRGVIAISAVLMVVAIGTGILGE